MPTATPRAGTIYRLRLASKTRCPAQSERACAVGAAGWPGQHAKLAGGSRGRHRDAGSCSPPAPGKQAFLRAPASARAWGFPRGRRAPCRLPPARRRRRVPDRAAVQLAQRAPGALRRPLRLAAGPAPCAQPPRPVCAVAGGGCTPPRRRAGGGAACGLEGEPALGMKLQSCAHLPSPPAEPARLLPPPLNLPSAPPHPTPSRLQNQGRVDQCRRRAACPQYLLGSRACRTTGAWMGGPSALTILRASPAANSTRFHLVSKARQANASAGDGGSWLPPGLSQRRHRARPHGPASPHARRTAPRAPLAPPTLELPTTAAGPRSPGTASLSPARAQLAPAWLTQAVAAAHGIPPHRIARSPPGSCCRELPGHRQCRGRSAELLEPL